MGAELVVDVVEASKNAQRKIHFPNRDIIKRRAGTAGHWRRGITKGFVDQPIEIEDINSTDDEEKNEERNKNFMMLHQLLEGHRSIIYIPQDPMSTPLAIAEVVQVLP